MANNVRTASAFMLASAVLLVISKFYVPLLSLAALTPFLAVLKSALEGEIKIPAWLTLSGLLFMLVFFFWVVPLPPGIDDILLVIFYGFTLTLAISLFFITNKFSKNRLGLFTIIFFWLGYDYLVLELYPQCSIFFLANIFNELPLVRWSHYTGFMGITAWILIANLLLYYVFFKGNAIFKGKIRWLSLVYALIIIFIPAMVGAYFLRDTLAITWHEMIDLYARNIVQSDPVYTERGEWVGRTAAWVSILILTYSFVKQKVK